MEINRLLGRLDEATCNFLAVARMRRELLDAGFEELDSREEWSLHQGGRYFVTKNDSALFAFIPGSQLPSQSGFRFIAAHSDSPCFKIKPRPEIYGDGGVVSLNVEKYGGGIMYTWFDRPLSLSGRVMLDSGNPLAPATRLIDFKRAIATIPHLAIHFNRSVNEGNPLSVQKDMKPVIGYFSKEQIEEAKNGHGFILPLLAKELGVEVEKILDYELCLYPLEPAGYCGVNSEYYQSGRIDDLSMAFGALEAMLSTAGSQCEATRMIMIFDNEETGSSTKQGAASAFARSLVERIVDALEPAARQAFSRCVAKSFLISADNAHAWHPNYNDKYDPTNHPVIGGGPVVKINANCKYMTDARSSAVFRALCRFAGVECQYFVNHADVAGGSTLGNILTSQLDLSGVDMGCAIWAMHSARETAGVADQLATEKVFSCFFS